MSIKSDAIDYFDDTRAILVGVEYKKLFSVMALMNIQFSTRKIVKRLITEGGCQRNTKTVYRT